MTDISVLDDLEVLEHHAKGYSAWMIATYNLVSTGIPIPNYDGPPPPNSKLQQTLDVLKHGPKTSHQLATAMKDKHDIVVSRLYKLMQRREVVKTGKRPFLYALTVSQ